MGLPPKSSIPAPRNQGMLLSEFMQIAHANSKSNIVLETSPYQPPPPGTTRPKTQERMAIRLVNTMEAKSNKKVQEQTNVGATMDIEGSGKPLYQKAKTPPHRRQSKMISGDVLSIRNEAQNNMQLQRTSNISNMPRTPGSEREDWQRVQRNISTNAAYRGVKAQNPAVSDAKKNKEFQQTTQISVEHIDAPSRHKGIHTWRWAKSGDVAPSPYRSDFASSAINTSRYDPAIYRAAAEDTARNKALQVKSSVDFGGRAANSAIMPAKAAPVRVGKPRGRWGEYDTAIARH